MTKWHIFKQLTKTTEYFVILWWQITCDSLEVCTSTKTGTDCCNISCESSNTPKARAGHQSWWGNVLDWQQSGAKLHSEHRKTLQNVCGQSHPRNLKQLWCVTMAYYVQTNENPADDCSRCLDMKKHRRVKRWFWDPELLWKPVLTWQNKVEHYEVDGDDKEVKIIKINSVQIQSNILSTLESRISFWKKMKRVMAYVILFINKLKQKQRSKVQELRLKENLLEVEKIHNAKKMIVKLVQEGAFGPDIKSIKKSCLNENNQQHASLQNKT